MSEYHCNVDGSLHNALCVLMSPKPVLALLCLCVPPGVWKASGRRPEEDLSEVCAVQRRQERQAGSVEPAGSELDV